MIRVLRYEQYTKGTKVKVLTGKAKGKVGFVGEQTMKGIPPHSLTLMLQESPLDTKAKTKLYKTAGKKVWGFIEGKKGKAPGGEATTRRSTKKGTTARVKRPKKQPKITSESIVESILTNLP